MKTTAIIMIMLLTLSIAASAEEGSDDGGESTLQDKVEKIKETAEKLKELVDKYGEMKLDIVKTEQVTITDQDGNGQSCELEAYYDSDLVSDLKTKADGTFTGNFNHGNRFPGRVISYRLSGCKCKVTSVEHKATFPQFDEHINRLKQLASDEAMDYATEKGKEAAEDAIKKGFDAAGAGDLAGPFLAGFKIGADLGAPFGEALTKGLNDMLELSLNQNKWKREALKGSQEELEPANYRRITARWWDLGRTSPMIANNWNIKVKCDPRYSTSSGDATWTDPKPKKKREHYQPSPEQRQVTARTDNYQEQQRQEWEKYERETRIAREAEAKRVAEAQARREAEIAKAAEEIKKTCKICDPIAQQINVLSNKIKDQEAAAAQADAAAAAAEDEAKKAQQAVDRASRAIEEFDNPQSWAESNGRRITSSDLLIDRMVARENFERYLDGDQTAAETENNWKNYDDKSRQEAKDGYRKSLSDALDAAKQKAEAANKDLSAKKDAASKANRDLASMNKQLAALKALLEECLKKCKEQARAIAINPQMTAEQLTGRMIPQTTQGPCQRYERLLSKYRLTPSKYESFGEEELIEANIPPGAHSAIESERRDCKREATPYVPQTTTRTMIPPPMTTTTTTTGTTTPTPQSCDEICSSRSMSPQKRDWSSTILSYLNSNGVCSKSASIDFGSYLMIGSCTCYPTSQPSIQISSEKLVCNTQCGTVPCGSKTSCSCGDNCRLDVECRWGGWRQVSERAFVPTAGAVS